MRHTLMAVWRVVIRTGLLFLLGPSVACAVLAPNDVPTTLQGLRVPFTANVGQTDTQVAYYAPTTAGTLFVTRQGELVYGLAARPANGRRSHPRRTASPGWSLTETFRGGHARPVAQGRSATSVSVFLGDDAARWRRDVPTYDQMSLGEVWPGVTVSLAAHGRSFEKIFTVQPGASSKDIRVRVSGAQALSVAGDGALVARTGLGKVTFTAPIAYQERDGARQPVDVKYRVTGRDYRFTVGAYDRTRPLVIDPLLRSTYLGGGDADAAFAMAIHPTTGDVYVAGATISTNFPGTTGGAQPANAGGTDAFMARLSGDLTTLSRATYLGGSGDDVALALAINAGSSEVYVAGYTSSTNFPHTSGGAQPTSGGNGDTFVARLSADLTTLTQATYLGGSGLEVAYGLAIAPATNDVYVTGYTDSTNFPGTANGAQAANAGNGDGFVARLRSDLATGALFQATYLGGSDLDEGHAVAIHPTTSDVYVAGVTESANMPHTSGGAQPALAGVQDAFVARLSASLTALNQASYLGGSDADVAYGLAIAPTGDVYAAGGTRSTDFPGVAGGVQSAFGGLEDAFVARLRSDLATGALTQATYLGGSDADVALALAINPTATGVYVTGGTSSAGFPGTSGGAQAALAGGVDAFVARLPASLTALTQATYVGGSDFDEALALAIHPATGDVYATGATSSLNLPGTGGAAQAAFGGGVYDAFVARLTSSVTLIDRTACCRDLDGDGNADILWWSNASGNVALWLMSGGSAIGSSGFGNMSPWVITGVGDFNGDGKADILWANSATGNVAMWFMNGGAISGTAGFGNMAPWVAAGIGDFNGDGKADILWANSATGNVAMWLMNGGTVMTATGFGNMAPWVVAGVGDFNGDGKADLLWRNTSSGNVALWLMNGGAAISSSGFGNMTPWATP